MTNKLIKEMGLLLEEVWLHGKTAQRFDNKTKQEFLVRVYFALEEAEKRGREEMRNEIAEDLNKLKPGNIQLWLAEKK